jgi:hypothetical protein
MLLGVNAISFTQFVEEAFFGMAHVRFTPYAQAI